MLTSAVGSPAASQIARRALGHEIPDGAMGIRRLQQVVDLGGGHRRRARHAVQVITARRTERSAVLDLTNRGPHRRSPRISRPAWGSRRPAKITAEEDVSALSDSADAPSPRPSRVVDVEGESPTVSAGAGETVSPNSTPPDGPETRVYPSGSSRAAYSQAQTFGPEMSRASAYAVRAESRRQGSVYAYSRVTFQPLTSARPRVNAAA
jgi:hypothetical protein